MGVQNGCVPDHTVARHRAVGGWVSPGRRLNPRARREMKICGQTQLRHGTREGSLRPCLIGVDQPSLTPGVPKAGVSAVALSEAGASVGSRTRINGFGDRYTIHCATPAEQRFAGNGRFRAAPQSSRCFSATAAKFVPAPVSHLQIVVFAAMPGAPRGDGSSGRCSVWIQKRPHAQITRAAACKGWTQMWIASPIVAAEASMTASERVGWA